MYFPEVDKTRVYVFGMFPKFLENLLEWNFVLLCCGHDESRTGYLPALVQLFRSILPQ